MKIGPIKTSKTELKDISKAWIVLSIAFAVVFSRTTLFNGNLFSIFSLNFIFLFLISLFTAGIGFLFHELAHKFSAQYFGCTAEFRAFDQMLYLALGLAIAIGFIFAAPGAVMISGMVTRKENGIISAAGPATNYMLGLIFLGLSLLLPKLNFIFMIGFHINFFLGLFNMIPFGNFDGIKILQWNRYIWLIMALLGGYFVFIF